jgi:amidase
MAPPFREFEEFDGLGLAELVKKKEVAPAELVEAVIQRIERGNVRLNAVIHRMVDSARKRATGSLSGPFAGVPTLLKDALAAYAGEPLCTGSRFYLGWKPDRHSYFVERLLEAGLIVVGKTNVPELTLAPVTEPDCFGPTRNPWNLERTPGGSSGGSGAAVAARWVPIASAGDGGGSIRIPASCCGVFGLKPSRGRSPSGPFEGLPWEGFSCEHVITRSVRDSAGILDATSGPAVGEFCAAPRPDRPFLQEVGRPPGRLRIGVTIEPVLTASVHPDCRAAVEDAASLLESLGHVVEHVKLDFDGAAYRRANTTMMCGIVAADVRDAEQRVGRQANRKDFEPSTWLLRTFGELLTAGTHAAAVREQLRMAKSVSAFVERFDVWLSPTLAAPPLALGALRPPGIDDLVNQWLDQLEQARAAPPVEALDPAADPIWSFMPYTSLANAAGLPSMSVPLYWNGDGLPIGVMFTGRYGDEAALFRLAAQLEGARPWAMRRPPFASS